MHVDLGGATQVFKSDCGKGDGRGRAYRLNLLSPLELDVSCTQTGDQVLQFSSHLAPLDQCDAHLVTCADPATLPGGCNFGIPAMQPGAYYLLVQAFTSGSEGTVDLRLRGVAQRVPEICDNGIDDDGDGAIDCNDRKCATDESPETTPWCSARPTAPPCLLAHEPKHLVAVELHIRARGRGAAAPATRVVGGVEHATLLAGIMLGLVSEPGLPAALADLLQGIPQLDPMRSLLLEGLEDLTRKFFAVATEVDPLLHGTGLHLAHGGAVEALLAGTAAVAFQLVDSVPHARRHAVEPRGLLVRGDEQTAAGAKQAAHGSELLVWR